MLKAALTRQTKPKLMLGPDCSRLITPSNVLEVLLSFKGINHAKCTTRLSCFLISLGKTRCGEVSASPWQLSASAAQEDAKFRN